MYIYIYTHPYIGYMFWVCTCVRLVVVSVLFASTSTPSPDVHVKFIIPCRLAEVMHVIDVFAMFCVIPLIFLCT